jgi:hypothetical protein
MNGLGDHDGAAPARGASDLRVPLHTAGAAAARRRRGPSLWLLTIVLAACYSTMVRGAIALTFQSIGGGVPLTGAGTNVAILNFGTVSAFGPVGSGVTRALAGSSYDISTMFGVRVDQILGGSPNYTLRARILSVEPLAWEVNDVSLATDLRVVATLQNYGSTASHSIGFTVPFSAGAGLKQVSLEIVAVAN